MRPRCRILCALAFASTILACLSCRAATIVLPKPALTGTVSLEEALAKRRSVRSYTGAPLTIKEVGQLLWAGQGVTGDGGKRTAPSAHASYPLALTLIAGNVEGVKPGAYRYLPDTHAIEEVALGDLRGKCVEVAAMQPWIKDAPAIIVVAVDYRKMSAAGVRGKGFADFEVGHAAQNVLLEATALHLGSVPVGAFDPAALGTLLKLPAGSAAAYALPVGHPR